jgi:hypothetical protein
VITELDISALLTGISEYFLINIEDRGLLGIPKGKVEITKDKIIISTLCKLLLTGVKKYPVVSEWL